MNRRIYHAGGFIYTYKLVAHGLLLESDFIKHLWEFVAYMMTLSVASLFLLCFAKGILDLLVRIRYSGYTSRCCWSTYVLLYITELKNGCICWDGATTVLAKGFGWILFYNYHFVYNNVFEKSFFSELLAKCEYIWSFLIGVHVRLSL